MNDTSDYLLMFVMIGAFILGYILVGYVIKRLKQQSSTTANQTSHKYNEGEAERLAMERRLRNPNQD